MIVVQLLTQLLYNSNNFLSTSEVYSSWTFYFLLLSFPFLKFCFLTSHMLYILQCLIMFFIFQIYIYIYIYIYIFFCFLLPIKYPSNVWHCFVALTVSPFLLKLVKVLLKKYLFLHYHV